MDPIENPAQSQPHSADLQMVVKACQTLRTQFSAILLILAVLTVSVNLLLFKAFRVAHRQLDEQERLTTQTLTDYKSNGAPRIVTFMNRITDFSKSHPDFNAILAKYPFQIPGQASPNAAPTQPTSSPAR